MSCCKLPHVLRGEARKNESADLLPQSWLGEQLQRGAEPSSLQKERGLSEMATLTRLGPDTPSIMEKGSKELEDTLAVERKKVRPRPPLPSQPAAHRPRRARAAAQGQTGQTCPHVLPRHLAAVFWAQGGPGAPWRGPRSKAPAREQHLHVHCTYTARALRMHVARSRGHRTASSAAPWDRGRARRPRRRARRRSPCSSREPAWPHASSWQRQS